MRYDTVELNALDADRELYLHPEYFPKRRPSIEIQMEMDATTDAYALAVLKVELFDTLLDQHAMDHMFTQREADYIETVVMPRRRLLQSRADANHALRKLEVERKNIL